MPTAGQRAKASDFPSTVQDSQAGSYTFTNTTFGVGTTGGTYATCGVAFAANTFGKVLLFYGGQLSNSNAVSTMIAPVVRTGSTVGSGSTVHVATDDEIVLVLGTSAMRNGVGLLVSGLTANDTYNVRIEHRVTSGTGTAARRYVVATPAT